MARFVLGGDPCRLSEMNDMLTVACGGGGVRWMRRSSGLLPRVRINLREDLLSSVLCGQVPKVLFLKTYVMIKYDTKASRRPTRGFVPSLQNAHFFHFCESARIIIFANLRVFGAKKEKMRRNADTMHA